MATRPSILPGGVLTHTGLRSPHLKPQGRHDEVMWGVWVIAKLAIALSGPQGAGSVVVLIRPPGAAH